MQYVGETGNCLRQRLRQHRHDIKINNKTTIGIHFNKTSHTFNHLKIIPIEIIKNENAYQRRTREFYWQLRLGTIFPKGLNNFPTHDLNLIARDTITTAQDYENVLLLRDLADE